MKAYLSKGSSGYFERYVPLQYLLTHSKSRVSYRLLLEGELEPYLEFHLFDLGDYSQSVLSF